MPEKRNRFRGITLTELIGFVFIGATLSLAAYRGCEYLIEPKLQTKNILGSEIPEKFYLVKNDTAYVEIDGAPVHRYVK